MKTPFISFLQLLFVALILFSCSKEINPRELIKAERLMQISPDSALQVLQSISNPKAMSKEHYAEYCLLLTEAQDKTYYLFQSDSVIRVAAEFYEKTQIKQKLPKAYYYMGRVHQELQEIPSALECYLKAEASAGDYFDDNHLMSRIYNSLGKIYTQLHIYDDAMHAYKKAEYYLYACGDSIGVPFVLRNMARIYHVTEKQDSALLYYQRAMVISRSLNNQLALISTLMEIAGLYTEQGNYRDAKRSLSEASILEPNESDSKQLASVYALFYHKTNQIDSALFFLRQSVQSKNRYTRSAAYYRFYQIEKERQNYKKALDYADQYYTHKDTLTQNLEREESLRIQSLYNFQKVTREKDNLQLEYTQKQQQVILLFFAFLFFSILCVFFFFYQRLCRKKECLLHEKQLKLKEELYENSQKRICENQNKIKYLDYRLQEKEKELDKAEKKMLEIRKKILQQENIRIGLSNDSKQLQYEHFYSTPIYNHLKYIAPQKYIESLVWKELKKTIDQIFDQFCGKLKSYYPKMSEKDLMICSLVKTKFSINEIANFVGLSKSAISQSRRRLYEKIHGVSGTTEDMDHFIDSL